MIFRFLSQIGYAVLIFLETLLSIRFVLKLINISDGVILIKWLYSFTDAILSPFMGILPNTINILGATVELTTLLVLFIIMVCSYALYEIIKAFE